MNGSFGGWRLSRGLTKLNIAMMRYLRARRNCEQLREEYQWELRWLAPIELVNELNIAMTRYLPGWWRREQGGLPAQRYCEDQRR